MQAVTTPSLTFTQSLKEARWPVKVVAVVIGSLVIASAAQIEVPLWPVPMTMQTFAVLVIAALYGARLGALTVALYLLEGAAGLPFFSGGSNLAALLAKGGTTLGYLAGFLLAAVVTGSLMERSKTLIHAVAAVIAGSCAIYALGVPWLAFMLATSSSAGDMGNAFLKAINFGLLPFLLGDALKAALAVAAREGIGRFKLS